MIAALPAALLLAALPGAVAPPEGLPLEPRLARHAILEAGEPVREVRDVVLQAGRLRIELPAGLLLPIHDEAGAAGLAFEGTGRLAFTLDDPAAATVLRRNTEMVLGRTRLRDGVVAVGFDRLLLVGRLGGLLDLDSLPQPSGNRPDRISARSLRDAARERLETFRSAGLPGWDHIAAEAEGNGRPGAFLEALVRSDAGDLVAVHDAVREEREALFRLERRRAAVPIAILPLGHARYAARQAAFRVTRTALTVDESGSEEIQVDATLDAVASAAGLRVLRFSLMNHQDGPGVAWYDGRHGVRVLSVSDAEGHPLPFSHRYHELLVELPEAAPVEAPVRIAFRIQGRVAVRPGGDRYFLLRTLAWFPRAPGDAEAYRMHWKVRTAAPFVPLVSGETVAAGAEDDRNFRETVTTLPVRFAAIAAGLFRCEEFAGRPRLRVCTYGEAKPRVAKDLAAFLGALAAPIERALVPYPFQELTVVEIPAYDLAQATPGMLLLSREVLQPHADPLYRILAQEAARAGREPPALGADAVRRMAHEMAHAWWGQVVKYRDPGDQWLSESFAEYFGGVALAGVLGGGVLERLREAWREAAVRGNEAATIGTAHLLAGPDGFERWSDLLYGKGPLVVDALRLELGEEPFLRSLRRLLRQTAGGFAGTGDLEAAIKEETGRDVAPLLERWVRGHEMPR